jgi:hypothetical protein
MNMRTLGPDFAFENALAAAEEQDADFFGGLAGSQEGRQKKLLLGESERCRNKSRLIRSTISFLRGESS